MRQFEFFILVAVGNLKYIAMIAIIYTLFMVSQHVVKISQKPQPHIILGYYYVCYFDHYHTPSVPPAIGPFQKKSKQTGQICQLSDLSFYSFFYPAQNFLEKTSFQLGNSEKLCQNLENSKDLGDKVKNQVKIYRRYS